MCVMERIGGVHGSKLTQTGVRDTHGKGEKERGGGDRDRERR